MAIFIDCRYFSIEWKNIFLLFVCSDVASGCLLQYPFNLKPSWKYYFQVFMKYLFKCVYLLVETRSNYYWDTSIIEKLFKEYSCNLYTQSSHDFQATWKSNFPLEFIPISFLRNLRAHWLNYKQNTCLQEIYVRKVHVFGQISIRDEGTELAGLQMEPIKCH